MAAITHVLHRALRALVLTERGFQRRVPLIEIQLHSGEYFQTTLSEWKKDICSITQV